jgi:predicted GH43/DUF377 family glycosyl hydrolase
MMGILFAHWVALLISFFVAGCLLGVIFSKPVRTAVVETLQKLAGLKLTRVVQNPVMKPSNYVWEAEAVFNPAALVLKGRTHLIYRAIGADGESRLGYASSPDGIVFDERLPHPVYILNRPRMFPFARRYNPVMFPSGGSWGGYEDPRMVSIEGQVYVTFNMFENWTLRVGYITMSEEDFLAKRFYKWQGPHVLSHGNRDKNWVLFPEKLGGQFAVLHSIIGDTSDRVRIEYIDDLTTLRERRFVSPDPQQVKDQRIAWHVHTRSAGPPPVKTDQGWLVFYHAHDAAEPSKYKVGAMLLDLKDPTRITHRSNTPVLEPDYPYENAGKPGVVFACGAVVREGILFLYYGGADKVVCTATAPLKTFLHELISGGETVLVPKPLAVS